MFEWAPRKAEANAAKHGVSFDEAVTAFLDANARVLMVAYTLRRSGNAETIRLISARRASRPERAAYGEKD